MHAVWSYLFVAEDVLDSLRTCLHVLGCVVARGMSVGGNPLGRESSARFSAHADSSVYIYR